MHRLSRTRGDGIPLSWALLLLFTILTGCAVVMLVEGLRNAGAAKPATVLDVVNGKMADTRVTVHGRFAIDDAVTQGGTDDPRHVSAIYVPLIDGPYAIYVRLEAAPRSKGVAGADGATGMVRTIDSDLRDNIRVAGGRTGTIDVDTHYYLSANETPARPLIWWPLAITGTAICLIMLATIVMRYVVFRPAPVEAPVAKISQMSARQISTPDQAAMLVRASGIFLFTTNPKARRRFLGVPAVLAEMASGDKGLVSQVNASETFMGSITKNLNGMWSMAFQK